MLNISKLNFTHKHTYPIDIENWLVIAPIIGGIFLPKTALVFVVAHGLSIWREQP